MRDACLDLVLGSSCTGCGRPGRLLCQACRARLPRHGSPAWPTPCPEGLARPLAGGEYAGLLKTLVNAHKEHRQFALARPLGEVLAAVLLDLARDAPRPTGPWLLVPVPSRRATARGRGHDPMLRTTRYAAARLRASGTVAVVVPLLRQRGAVQDQSGLDAAARAANLAGTMRCRARAARTALRRWPRPQVAVVDDVLTTGATAREAQRALEVAGVPVDGIAAVAATRKRHA